MTPASSSLLLLALILCQAAAGLDIESVGEKIIKKIGEETFYQIFGLSRLLLAASALLQ